MSSQNIGSAKIQAGSLKPALDLATLVELLAESIPTKENRTSTEPNPNYKPIFEFDTKSNRLRLSSPAVLRRLYGLERFKTDFDPSKGSGFIQDLQPPRFGTKSLLGGNLTQGSRVRLSTAVDKLVAVIDKEINAAIPQTTPLSVLLLNEPTEHLQQLAKTAGTKFLNQLHTANLVPIAFPTTEAKPQTQNKPIAKVISAREQIDIDADEYFERMCSAVKDYGQNQLSWDDDDTESAINSLIENRDQADGQLTRFFNFLDDEALARVRLTITLRIMQAIAQYSSTSNHPKHQLLIEYVNRVTNLLTSATKVGYTVDLTAHFGSDIEFDLSEYLNQANLYRCLSVWAEWKTQLFEGKAINQQGHSYGVVREVSYRFRINGKNPEQNKSAFLARIDKIEAELLPDDETVPQQPYTLRQNLAELIFLFIVIPRQIEENISADALPNFVEQLLKNIQKKEDIRLIIEDLRDRESSMQKIADALINVLQTKSQNIISQVQQQSAKQFICVKRDIIEWSRLEGAEPGVRDLLKTSPQAGRENVEWFKHIEICNTPETPGLLFSVQVNTEISEHNLVTKGETYSIQAQRSLTPGLLQILWVDRPFSKDEKGWKYEVSENAREYAKGWILPAAVIIDYDVTLLTRRSQEKSGEESKQYHAAAVTAFAVLIYCCLWCIINKLNQGSKNDFTTLMLRLQERGKDSDQNGGDNYIYAAAQTIEAILAEDTKIRMQGINIENLTKPNSKYVKIGVFDALTSAFPLFISTPSSPRIAKIGLISYATRPCNETTSSAQEKDYLFLTQSYIATAVSNPFTGYELKGERKQSDIISSPEQLKKQRLVQEEIRYLKDQGCEHIILLSHAYGGRRFNRIADYNSILTPRDFIEDVLQTFPDLNIYPMQRDVFPATRLKQRSTDEAGFEILRAAEHSNFLHSFLETVQIRELIPVYTFATLFAVQEDKRPQSGFCVYFLISDKRVSNINWTERARQHLINAEGDSLINPCLISVLRGLHFLEAERGVKNKQLIPVLDPFPWISPNTVEAAGEVEVLHTRRRGRVYLSYPAVLTHISQVLHRRK